MVFMVVIFRIPVFEAGGKMVKSNEKTKEEIFKLMENYLQSFSLRELLGEDFLRDIRLISYGILPCSVEPTKEVVLWTKNV